MEDELQPSLTGLLPTGPKAPASWAPPPDSAPSLEGLPKTDWQNIAPSPMQQGVTGEKAPLPSDWPEWDKVSPLFKQIIPELPDQEGKALYERYRHLRAWRKTAEQSPESLWSSAIKEGAVPFGSPIYNTAKEALYQKAKQSFEAGNLRGIPSDPSFNNAAMIAHYEEEQKRKGEEGYGPGIARGLAKIPGIAGEAAVAGKLMGGIGLGGTALYGGAVNPITAAARGLAGFGLRTAATAAVMPSMWAEQWTKNNQEAGRDPLDLRGAAPAYAVGTLQTAVLGSLGKVANAMLPGEGIAKALARIPIGAGTGMVEQQAADALAGAVGLQSDYGILGDLLEGKKGEALKRATVQAVTFVAFAAMHHGPEAGQKVLDAYTKNLRESAKEGLKPEEAGQHAEFSQAEINQLVENVQKMRAEGKLLQPQEAPQVAAPEQGPDPEHVALAEQLMKEAQNAPEDVKAPEATPDTEAPPVEGAQASERPPGNEGQAGEVPPAGNENPPELLETPPAQGEVSGEPAQSVRGAEGNADRPVTEPTAGEGAGLPGQPGPTTAEGLPAGEPRVLATLPAPSRAQRAQDAPDFFQRVQGGSIKKTGRHFTFTTDAGEHVVASLVGEERAVVATSNPADPIQQSRHIDTIATWLVDHGLKPEFGAFPEFRAWHQTVAELRHLGWNVRENAPLTQRTPEASVGPPLDKPRVLGTVKRETVLDRLRQRQVGVEGKTVPQKPQEPRSTQQSNAVRDAMSDNLEVWDLMADNANLTPAEKYVMEQRHRGRDLEDIGAESNLIGMKSGKGKGQPYGREGVSRILDRAYEKLNLPRTHFDVAWHDQKASAFWEDVGSGKEPSVGYEELHNVDPDTVQTVADRHLEALDWETGQLDKLTAKWLKETKGGKKLSAERQAEFDTELSGIRAEGARRRAAEEGTDQGGAGPAPKQETVAAPEPGLFDPIKKFLLDQEGARPIGGGKTPEPEAVPPHNQPYLVIGGQRTYPGLTRKSPKASQAAAEAAAAPAIAEQTLRYMKNRLETGGKRLAALGEDDLPTHRLGAALLQTRMDMERTASQRDVFDQGIALQVKINALIRQNPQITAAQIATQLQKEMTAYQAARKHAPAVRTLIGGQSSAEYHFTDRADYDAAKKDLDALIAQGEWGPVAEDWYKKAMNTLPPDRNQIKDFPMKAIALDPDTNLPIGAARTGTNTTLANERIRRMSQSRQASLEHDLYDTSLIRMMDETMRGRIPDAARANAVKEGLRQGTIRQADQAPQGWREMMLQPGKGIPELPKGERWFTHPDAYHDYERALGIEQTAGQKVQEAIHQALGTVPGARKAADVAGLVVQASLATPGELMTHLGVNIPRMLWGGEGFNPHGLPLEKLPQFVTGMWKSWKNNPDFLKKLVDVTQLGAGYEPREIRGVFANHPLDPTYAWQKFAHTAIQLGQESGRVLAGDVFDSLVASGKKPGGDAAKRDFINEYLGNYNGKAANAGIELLKAIHLQEFSTAASTTYEQTIKAGLGFIGNAPNATWKQAITNRALQTAKLLPLLALPAIYNKLRYDDWFPDDIPPFAFKTDEGYRDLLSVVGVRQGWRHIGAEAALEGKPDKAVKDVAMGLLHPVAGPVPDFLTTAVTGHNVRGDQLAERVSTAKTPKGIIGAMRRGSPPPDTSQTWENLKAALVHANPILKAIFPQTKRERAQTGSQTLESLLPGSFQERTTPVKPRRLGTIPR